MKNSKKPLISICVPVFNEEDVLPILFSRLNKVLSELVRKYNFELILTDNNSSDNTWKVIREQKDIGYKSFSVRAYRFSRNFGFQNSILENFRRSHGDAVIQLDADLQDPPELIPEFLSTWESGSQIVYGIRRSRAEGILSTKLRTLGYWFLDIFSEHPIPPNAGDFRLLDRKVVNALAQQNLVEPFLRGSIAGLGFNQSGIPFDRTERTAGKSKFPPFEVLTLGIKGVINHSLIPLRLSTYLGALVLITSALGGFYYFLQSRLNPELPEGFTTTQVLILSGIGLNAFFLGIIGEYISRIYRLVRAEPNVIIQDEL
jgi:glycosyltransferase involved in cell wall biosynthesis